MCDVSDRNLTSTDLESTMLILTRKIGEEIVINENTRISIQRIRGGRVRVAIDAPQEVSILRGELAFDTPSSGDECDRSWRPSPGSRKVAAETCCR